MWEMTKDDIHSKEYSDTWRGLDTPVCQKKNVKSFLTQLTLLDVSNKDNQYSNPPLLLLISNYKK